MINPPLSNLPQQVVDAIWQQLSLPSLAVCSLVCKGWKDLLYEYLPGKLLIQSGPLATGLLQAGLHRCRHVHTICVTSSKDAIWPHFAAALAHQQLPSLRELHIQHSSQTDAAHLEQLCTIMQVQGEQCALHLALTDKASLQALLPLLPLRGLASLELNVPYLAEGALQLLLHAASIQTAALANSTHRHPSTQLQHCQPQPQQQQVLRVGLWVCCWGGCPGLLLSEAVGLYARLQQLPCCSMTGCESINLSNTADLVALTQLQGLVALGVNFTSSTSAQEPLAADASTLPAPGEEAALGTEASTAEGSITDSTSISSGGMGAAWASLTTLSSNLRQLSIRGSPAAGWGTPPTASPHGHTVMQQQQLGLQQLPQAPQQHWLSSLTGLTKLSLLKDWSRPALPVSPIAGLTLLQELALERHGLQHAGELSCLSTLTDLRVLSLVLTATADELLEAVQEGNWKLAVSPEQLQAQQQCAAVLNRLSLLQVGASAAAADAEHSLGQPGPPVAPCSCCCSSTVGVSDAAQHPQQGPGEDGAGMEEEDGAGPSFPAPEQLLQQVLSCPVVSGVSAPVLLDWQWLRQLQQLETAWLQVPHLDLGCLPSSLVELDAQQPRDLTRVSITCSSSTALSLPRLQRLVLPHRLQACEHQVLLDPDVSMVAADTADSSSDGMDESDSSIELQRHQEAALLLSIVEGCPELKGLELVQWQPCPAAVLAAVRHLRFLRLLSVVGPDSYVDELQRQVQAARVQDNMRAVDLQLQEPLVLSSYPWSSVLAVR